MKYIAGAALRARSHRATHADQPGRNWIGNTRVIDMLEAKD